MTIFYRGPRIVITHRDFRILWPCPRVFIIRELFDVQVVLVVRARRFELWARHQGTMVCLFSTCDERSFGQVKRALVRAMEQTVDA
ncbi:DUF6232 family protein [Micromonospora sp. CPCC 206061]|uniref:DUF6232 family protein n=1 Tax=Micromonospora sp. CPCC 206061 TaxID=3122410 RepID=UPI002FF1A2EF